MGSSTITRTNIRPLRVVADKMSSDPIACANQSAFIRVVLNQFVARSMPVKSGRELGAEFNCKTADSTTCISLTRAERKHFDRYARAAGRHKFGALVHSALCAHYFPGGAPKATKIDARRPDVLRAVKPNPFAEISDDLRATIRAAS
jgi:hypothetical protein